jgi:hypothetical protein
MTDTTVQMDRTIFPLPDGTNVYQISAVVQDKGDLLHPNIFVYQILDPLDTTRDTFVRVGNPYDLENIETTRAAAITNGQEYFLQSSLLRRYSDLNQAVQAKDAVRSRIDNSVNAWHTYKADFEGSELLSHPTAEATFEQQLQDDYSDAKDARIAADVALAAADVALALAQDDAADAFELGEVYKDDLTFTEQAYATYWIAFYAAENTFYQNMLDRFTSFKGDFLVITGFTYISSGNVGGTAAQEAWLDHLQQMEIDLHTVATKAFNGSSLDSSFRDFHTSVGGLYAAQQGVISTANVTAAAAVTAKKEAEASLASAQLAEDAALAAVLAVCPDFDPASV